MANTLFFHYNTRPHAEHLTQDLPEKFRWDVFGNLPYSPDHENNEFNNISNPKERHESGRFLSKDDLKE